MVKKKSVFNEIYNFNLNGNKVDFEPYILHEICSQGKEKDIKYNDKYLALATMLFAKYKRKKYILTMSIERLHARLFVDIKKDIEASGERGTEKLVESTILNSVGNNKDGQKYLELLTKKDDTELRLDALYGIISLASKRREDIKFFYGDYKIGRE